MEARVVFQVEWSNDIDGVVHMKECKNLDDMFNVYCKCKNSIKHGYCKDAMYEVDCLNSYTLIDREVISFDKTL